MFFLEDLVVVLAAEQVKLCGMPLYGDVWACIIVIIGHEFSK